MAPETAQLPRGHATCRFMHEMLGALGIAMSRDAAQPLLDPGAGRGLPGLGADLAHPARLRDARLRPLEPGGASMPASIRYADHHHRHADLRRAGRHDGAQRGHGRPAPAGARLRRRRRLRRHRGGADGPLASGRHRARGDPLRHPLPGRRRARLRHAGDQPRHDRRHPGAGHPLRRRAGAPVARAGRARASLASARRREAA